MPPVANAAENARATCRQDAAFVSQRNDDSTGEQFRRRVTEATLKTTVAKKCPASRATVVPAKPPAFGSGGVASQREQRPISSPCLVTLVKRLRILRASDGLANGKAP